MRGDDAAQHDRGLAGCDQAHERAGLKEGEPADEQVRPAPEGLRELGQRVLEVGQFDDARDHEHQRRQGERGGEEHELGHGFEYWRPPSVA